MGFDFKVKIVNVADALVNGEIDYQYGMFNIKDKQGRVIISFDTIAQYLYMYYRSWFFCNPQAHDNPMLDLNDIIERWNENNIDSIQRVLDTLNADYDPIENYNKISEINNDGFVESRSIGGDTVTNNYGAGTTTVNKNGSVSTTVNQNNVMDSGSFVNVAKSEITSPAIINEESARTDTTMTSGRTETTTRGDNTVTEHTHGNIGVMTNQSMIESELKLRKNNSIVKTLMDMFAKDCLFIL